MYANREKDRFGGRRYSAEEKERRRRRPGAVKTAGAGACRPDEISSAVAADASSSILP